MKITLKLITIILLLFISLNSNSILAKKVVGVAAIIIDYDTQEVLFEVNADTLNYPASLTKMMTVYIIFDYLKKNKLSWNSKMLVSKNAASRHRSKLYVEQGSHITVNDAVRALIIKSANDVATVVAENISKSEREFAKLMTKYAKKIGMKTVGITAFDGGVLKKIADEGIHITTGNKEYGPAEDIHMILDHLISAYLNRYIKK